MKYINDYENYNENSNLIEEGFKDYISGLSTDIKSFFTKNKDSETSVEHFLVHIENPKVEDNKSKDAKIIWKKIKSGSKISDDEQKEFDEYFKNFIENSKKFGFGFVVGLVPFGGVLLDILMIIHINMVLKKIMLEKVNGDEKAYYEMKFNNLKETFPRFKNYIEKLKQKRIKKVDDKIRKAEEPIDVKYTIVENNNELINESFTLLALGLPSIFGAISGILVRNYIINRRRKTLIKKLLIDETDPIKIEQIKNELRTAKNSEIKIKLKVKEKEKELYKEKQIYLNLPKEEKIKIKKEREQLISEIQQLRAKEKIINDKINKRNLKKGL